MKKVLICGNADSIWIQRYIKNILLGGNFHVFLANACEKNRFESFYKQNNVTVIDQQPFPMSFLGKIPKIRGFLNIVGIVVALRRYGGFDIIHIHSVNTWALRIVNLIKTKSTKIVLSYWGSDLLRKSNKSLVSERKYLYMADCITLSTKQMRDKFLEVYGNKYKNIIKTPLFGISAFEEIKNMKEYKTIRECKEMLGLNTNKVTIAVGYNRISAQQHDKVLQQIGKLPSCEQAKIEIVLQCGYGTCSSEYWQSINDISNKLLCKVIIMDKFINNTTVAALRVAVDIFINAQITDAFSATLQEYIYAGAITVNPTWIEYDELDDYKIEYIKYNDIEQLPEIIIGLLKGDVNKITKNKIIAEYTSWEAVKKDWINCY